jgi:hypothetical protein
VPFSIPDEAVFDDVDDMGRSVPLADQPRARLERRRRFAAAMIAIGRAVDTAR